LRRCVCGGIINQPLLGAHKISLFEVWAAALNLKELLSGEVQEVVHVLTQSPNSSLQRTGGHKVLGRGRDGTEARLVAARPRAEAHACRR
jgi:hypothetical protein